MTTTLTPTSQAPLQDLIDLTGKSAIVTGGAMGIGLGIARRLHEAGASVLIADLDHAAAAESVAPLLAARPDSALAVHADVSDAEGVRRMVSSAVERFGSLDILVNNAGIYPMVPFTEMDAATFRRVLEVNLTGLFLCTKAATERMIEQGRGGRIVNVTSIDALHPSMVGLAHYDASKHGAWGFTKNVALELARYGIWVNAVAPGGINTPGTGGEANQENMEAFAAAIPMGRIGDPDDIGRAVLFLASELASYVTGTQIVVDGGRLLG
ncbi:MAG TPA: SDR family NAD(P)-dependent oxidoreductase [Solirubrobacteraceae bacterium]|nr:SDR family NAD(P)-dependent oxidoreductase [Solirubrobacteraceae bacterium]